VIGAATMRIHVMGKRHCARADAKRGVLRCAICDLTLENAHQLRQHRAGRRHYRRAARLFARQEKARLRARQATLAYSR
jgi:hypothetical protein